MGVPLLAALGIIFTGQQILNTATSLFPPLQVDLHKKAYSAWPNLNPAIGDMINMVFRGQMSMDEYKIKAEEFGYDNITSEALFTTGQQLLTVADYISAQRRGIISEDDMYIKLQALGLSDEDVDNALKVTEFFPSPGDLVRFAVREVYNPDIVDKFKMLEDLPPMFITESAKAGLPESQAKNYWASHWVLPSIGQGFQMLHRRIITEEEVNLLLKTLDVMPFWRNALIKLSYNPLTRVDVRRMYSLGVLDEDAVRDAYLDGGYSPENAERMLEFTKKYEADTNTGITRASVIKAYKDDLIDYTELQTYLKALGYSEEVVDFWLTMSEYEKTYANINDTKKELIALFKVGAIPEHEIRNGLAELDLPASYINNVIKKVELSRSEKIKMPTRLDLDRWLRNALIEEKIYTRMMLNLGYRQEDVERYLEEVTSKQDTEKRKYMTTKTYLRWLKSDIISLDRFKQIAQEMHISGEDIANLILETQGD